MPYFKNDNINVLFIHIPKTGGTSVELYFSSKFNLPLNNSSLFLYFQDKELLFNKNIKINSSLQHLTYNQIVEHNQLFNINFDNIKIITIVRNPYERIISDLFFWKIITKDVTKETVFDIINNYLDSNKYDNHNIPQYKFITNDKGEIIQNIHILKTESLTNDMNNLGYNDFKIFENVNMHKVNYYDYLNNKSIDIINQFYHLDFILFNYDKISNFEVVKV
jgi:hypothetical protein